MVVVIVVVEELVHQHACAEREQPGRDQRSGAVSRFGRRSRGGGCRCDGCRRRRRVDGDRVVRWDIDLAVRGGLQHDDFLAVLRLVVDRHLWRRLQVADRLSLLSQPLHRVEHARLVGRERLTELGGPVHFAAHHVQCVREIDQRAHRRRETHLGCRVVERLARKVLVLEQPVSSVEHFLRIRRGDQHLRQDRIRVQGDRREQLLECLGRPAGDSGGRDRSGLIRAVRCRGLRCCDVRSICRRLLRAAGDDKQGNTDQDRR